MHPLRHIPARTAAVAAGTAAAALALAAVAAPATPAGATDTPSTSATAEYQAALKAVGSQGVHFDSTATQSGATLDVSGDAGKTSGSQDLVVKNGGVTERLTARVVGSTGYVTGNAAALQHVIGLTAAQSSKYASKWLSFPTSNTGLERARRRLLSSQVSKELQIGGPFTYGTTTTVAGQHVLAIKGSVATQSGSKVPVVLYVPASGSPLPIKEVTNAGGAGGSSAIHGTVTVHELGREQEPDGALAHGVVAETGPPDLVVDHRGVGHPVAPLLQAVQGDITAERVDAVVNAANRRLRGGGGVDGAIHRAAGAERLQAACRAIGECPPGRAVVTDGFDLPARFIIHTVGPVWHGGTQGEPETLAACYRNALAVADQVGARSVAFPAISTGVYGYPLGQAAEVA